MDLTEEELEILELHPYHEIVNTILPGKYFGEIALRDRVKRTATVVCSKLSYLLVLNKKSYEDILQ